MTAAKAIEDRRGVDQALWLRVLDAQRKMPQRWVLIAESCGCTPRTVHRLWEKGCPRFAWGVRPMRDIILEERQAATAKAAAAAEAVRGPSAAEVSSGRRAAAETMAAEATLLKFARANVQALLHMTTQLSATGMRLARAVDATMSDPKILDGMSLHQGLLTLTRIAHLTQKGIYAAESCAELERLVLGDPRDRAQLEGADRDMGQDEALEIIGRAADLAKRVEERGFRVLVGGKDPRNIKLEFPPDAPAAGEQGPE